MRQTFELIIFDCDGTLITSEVLNNTAVSKALAHLGHLKYNLDFCLNSFTGKSFKDICKVVEQNENCKIDKNLFGKLISRFSIDLFTVSKIFFGSTSTQPLSGYVKSYSSCELNTLCKLLSKITTLELVVP